MTPPELERRVRPVGGGQRRRRPLARRLRHRLPDPRARDAISPCRRQASTRRSTICATRSSTRPIPARRARAARLCALCAGAQRPAGDRRSALSRRRQARRLQDAAGQGAARGRRSRCSATARAPARSSPRRSTALDAEQDDGLSRPDYGSRLRDAAARARAARRGQSAAGRNPRRRRSRAPARRSKRPRAERTYTSTQEKNWMVLAAEALAEHDGARPVQPSTGSRSRARSTAVERRGLGRSRSRSRMPAGRRPARDDGFGRRRVAEDPAPRKATRSSARSTSSTEPRPT